MDGNFPLAPVTHGVEERTEGDLATRIFQRTDWYVTSPFGRRKHPVTGEVKLHKGTDYGTRSQKWPQYAADKGTVTQAGRSSDGALYCWVQYPAAGIRCLHYHLDSVRVKAGQAVDTHTVLGYTGATGNATGIHLHLGLQRLANPGVYADPHPYVFAPAANPIKAGDRVRVKQGAKTYTGGKLASFVYSTVYKVMQISGDRAVIGLGKAVTAAVRIADLTKA
ncbi:MAG: M23 family metallopeptidase [Firmicutes bacterium]|nr:M23 family metallopeptidase [Bacillota bacterium]